MLVACRLAGLSARVLALCAPVAAHTCNNSMWDGTDPVGEDEIIAAGLEPLLSQADRELRPDAASQYLYKWRMNALADWARCGNHQWWDEVNVPGWAEGQLAKAEAAKDDQAAQWAATQAAEAAKAAAFKKAYGPLL
jgi:hypothetical protein